MSLTEFPNSPFKPCIAFHHIIARWQHLAAAGGPRAALAKAVLEQAAPFPEFVDGITHADQLINNADVIRLLLSDIFPEMLTHNEIKAVTMPLRDLLFNQTSRLQKILEAAGPSFDITIRDFTDHQFYVLSCCIIMNEFYGRRFDLTKPFFYDIPTADGVMKHYRILYNADFLDILPTENSIPLSVEDIEMLRDNFNDLELWKQKFPQNSWILKGFAIVNLYDATVENSVSTLKGTLLGNSQEGDVQEIIVSVFRSIYRIPDLRVGFTAFDVEEQTFSPAVFSQKIRSFILPGGVKESAAEICDQSLESIVGKKSYFAVSDISKFIIANPKSVLGERFNTQGVKSFILAPVIKNGMILGILELVSTRAGELNSINANQLDIVMPFITDTIDRQYRQMDDHIQVLIQNEFTAIHPSVYWKFKNEALTFIQHQDQKKEYTLKEVIFKHVYPLYGQIDIKGSSDTRNLSVQLDLQNQMQALTPLIEELYAITGDEALQQKIKDVDGLLKDLRNPLRADTEQHIQHYLEEEVYPFFKEAAAEDANLSADIKNYFMQAERTGDFHLNRRKYQTTVTLINEKMALMLDRWQVKAQTMFPHYYERFKTDGVEHNLYIGAAITPKLTFNTTHLYNLRLWQLQALCEMEIEHFYIKGNLPYPLEVTSLILAFSSNISIRFRMDEKRFDVDGTYNARFEIIKKRIDKSFIKDTTKRITAVGKVTIVYSNQEEHDEYLKYINFLRSKNMFVGEIEQFEIEELQGITGLMALRVIINYALSLPIDQCFTYQDMMEGVPVT